MLLILIKKQLLELFQSYVINKKTGKSRGKHGMIVLVAFFIALFFGLGFAIFSGAVGVGKIILNCGYNWIYYSLLALLSIAFGVFGSVFNTYAAMYLPKDNEFLITLPLPSYVLLIARICGVFVTSLMYSSLVWIPGMIAYFVIVPLSVSNVVLSIVTLFIIALFVTCLSCILGFVVAMIAKKTKGKSIITVLFSIVFLTIYYIVYFKAINSMNEFISNIGTVKNIVQTWFHYSYFLGKGADGDVVLFALALIITLILIGICVFVLSKTYSRLIMNGEGIKSTKRVRDNYSLRSQSKTLLNREFKHFLSVSTWMLNGGIGALVLPVLAIVSIVKANSIKLFIDAISTTLPNLKNDIPFFLALGICFIISTSCISAVSISIEGRNMWITQSLPIEPWEIVRAKEKMAIYIEVIPAIISAIVMGIVIHLKIWEILLAIIAVIMFVVLNTDFGIYLNILKPQYNWTNAATLTKQSTPVVVNMFGGWAFCIAIGIGGFFLSDIIDGRLVLAIFSLVLTIIEFIIHKYLKDKGCKKIAIDS